MRGVRGVRLAGPRIGHRFSIAVVGRDQQRAVGNAYRFKQPSKAAIHRLDRLDRCFHDPGMADHIGVGVVDHYEVVNPDLDRLD